MGDRRRDEFMKHNTVIRFLGGLCLVLLSCAVLGGLLVGFAYRADRQIRAELLQEARMVARSVNLDHIKALTATEADLASPDYVRLKEQLMLVRSANPRCQFLYLLGRKEDGSIFFFVDSENPSSVDYSPPGQIYHEVSDKIRRATPHASSYP